MTRHFPDLGCASDWLNQISRAPRPIKSTTQIWVVTRYQYGISALVSQANTIGDSFCAAGCKENHFYSLTFGQAEASIY